MSRYLKFWCYTLAITSLIICITLLLRYNDFTSVIFAILVVVFSIFGYIQAVEEYKENKVQRDGEYERN